MTWKPDYLTLPQGKDWLRYTKTDRDTDIASLITAVSRSVDGFCNRQFGNTSSTVTRTYRKQATALLDGSGYLVAIDDLRDDTGLLVTAEAATVTGFTLWPDNAAEEGRPYTGLLFDARPYPPFTVASSRWGWAGIPHGVKHATRLQLNRWFWRQESPHGVAGSPSDGSEVRLSARLDPDVRVVLSTANLRRTRKPG